MGNVASTTPTTTCCVKLWEAFTNQITQFASKQTISHTKGHKNHTTKNTAFDQRTKSKTTNNTLPAFLALDHPNKETQNHCIW